MPIADAITPTLSRLKSRYADSRLPVFLGWWFGELRALLPQRWQQRLAVQEAELRLLVDGEQLRVARALDGHEQPLAEIELAPREDLRSRFETTLGEDMLGLRRVLLLPREAVLRRRLNLPAAARDRLHTMLAFELDRQTPFRADQVYFDARVLPHGSDARQLPVELVLVPRDVLGAVLERLGPMAAVLDGVDAADDGRRLGCNLLPPDRRRPRSARTILVNLALVAASLVFVFLGLQQIVDNREQAVLELQAEVERQRSAARGTAQLRSALDEAVAAANFLAVQKAEQPSMLEVLSGLTAVLPDDTWLERLTVTRDGLNMSGQSASAAQLIERLQQAEHLRNPSLVGAIQPDPQTGRDRFNVGAELAAGTGAAP